MLPMSLVMFYNGYLASDRKGTMNNEYYLEHEVDKMYVSEDRVFAGVCAGDLLKKNEWESLRNIFDLITSDKKPEEGIFNDLETNVICCYDKQIYIVTFENKGYKIFKYESKEPIFKGNGKWAASVIANNHKTFPLDKFFRYVSYSETSTGSSFNFVKLSTLKRRPK